MHGKAQSIINLHVIMKTIVGHPTMCLAKNIKNIKFGNSSFIPFWNKSGGNVELNLPVLPKTGIKVEKLKVLFQFHSSFVPEWKKSGISCFLGGGVGDFWCKALPS